MSFWQVFITLMIFIPLVMLWVFTLIDLFQRSDLSGIAKALWAIAIVLLPLIGMLIYFFLRESQPSDAAPGRSSAAPPPPAVETPSAAAAGAADVANDLERLAGLRDKGILSDEEFQREKDKLLGYDA